MKKLVREPLVHFLVIGAVLFGVYRMPGDRAGPGTSNRIVVSAGDIEQMRAIFRRQWHRPPTEEELKEFIAARVQEEVLYREALTMGLERDDTIVRRRLAQKFEFLMEDLSDLGEPTDAELTAFFKEHGDRYQVPGRLTFVHVYFSVGKRGKKTERDAKNDLARLRAGAPAAEEMGDAFLLEYAYKQATPEEIAKVFGPGFAAQLTETPVREWHGPIASAYGLHLVKVDEHETSRASALDAVREQVKRDWLDARRRQIKDSALKKLMERYEVVVDDKSLRAAVIAHGSAAGSDR